MYIIHRSSIGNLPATIGNLSTIYSIEHPSHRSSIEYLPEIYRRSIEYRSNIYRISIEYPVGSVSGIVPAGVAKRDQSGSPFLDNPSRHPCPRRLHGLGEDREAKSLRCLILWLPHQMSTIQVGGTGRVANRNTRPSSHMI